MHSRVLKVIGNDQIRELFNVGGNNWWQNYYVNFITNGSYGVFKNTCTSKYHIKHYEKSHAKHN